MNPTLDKLIRNIETVIIGKRAAVERAVVTLLARGHLLIEDVPGVGKTMLARALAKSIHADFRRLQFTPDLLPGDVTGSSVFNPKDLTFEFRRGPIFTQVLLADEINRATPRTQSSLLEAMEERQVSSDGRTYPLEGLFFVIATQNPIELQGTFPLPEAQLDRFAMRISIGYPAEGEEISMLAAVRGRHPIDALQPVADLAEIVALQDAAARIDVHESVLSYIRSVVDATRKDPNAAVGASPRGAIFLMRVAQAQALLAGRAHVEPDDVKLLAPLVLGHRVFLKPQARLQGKRGEDVVAGALRQVAVPVGPDA